MRLWDTSLWIAAFRDAGAVPADDPDLELLVTCGPVVQELLQGARPRARAPLEERLRAVPRIGDPVDLEAYIEAAKIYQIGRDLGFTIRSNVDCLVAAIAIANGAELWHRDRDYATIARFTPLRQRAC